MSEQPQKKDPVVAFVERYCPDLDDEARQKAEDTLRRYLAFCVRQNERIFREWRERASDPGGHGRE